MSFLSETTFSENALLCPDLITAQDLTAQLKGERLGSRLLIPCNMLKTDEDVFLDDFTVRQVSDALQVPIDIVKSSGQDFIDAVIGEKQTDPDCKTVKIDYERKII